MVGECTLPTEGMRSIISMVSISLEGFLPSILLLVVTVVIVAVILVVVVVAIVGVVIVVMIIGVFVIVTIIRVVVEIGWAYAFPPDKASSVRVPVANVTLFLFIATRICSLVCVSFWDCRAFAMAAVVIQRKILELKTFGVDTDKYCELSDSIGKRNLGWLVRSLLVFEFCVAYSFLESYQRRKKDIESRRNGEENSDRRKKKDEEREEEETRKDERKEEEMRKERKRKKDEEADRRRRRR
ncbi:hypothetical protein Tco_1515004 [Tanacetum coccineum]